VLPNYAPAPPEENPKEARPSGCPDYLAFSSSRSPAVRPAPGHRAGLGAAGNGRNGSW
jgi:hypothetical protein